jgi:hypothetical protein
VTANTVFYASTGPQLTDAVEKAVDDLTEPFRWSF